MRTGGRADGARARGWLVLGLLVLAAGCGSPGPAARTTESTGTPDEQAPSVSAAPGTGDTPTTSARGAPSEAPVLAIRGAGSRTGVVAITLENRGTTEARIAPDLRLERRDDSGRFAPVGAAGITLRDDCEHAAPSCVALLPGATLHPPDWLGTIGDAQCVCEHCVPAPAGTYRFVATSCDGQHTVAGEPFER